VGGKLFLKERAKDGAEAVGKESQIAGKSDDKGGITISVIIIVVIHPERYRNRKVLGMTRDQ
jgi:hypothetical protein